MAAVFSQMIALGSTAPDFYLPDVISGSWYALDSLRGKTATVILFICNHCPSVKHINKALVNLANNYAGAEVKFIAISSNDVEAYPEDSPENMKIVALEQGYSFPYLYDETQDTARAYGATCTPDIFIYDKDMRLVYCGQFDSSRPSNGKPSTGEDVRAALEALLVCQKVSVHQIPSIGCGIKWKKNK